MRPPASISVRPEPPGASRRREDSSAAAGPIHARLRRTDGGLVRLMTPIRGTTESAFDSLEAFSAAMASSVAPSAMRIRLRVPRLSCCLVPAVAAAACSGDPKAASRKYAESGDVYVQQRQYKEAIIEYRNALKATPDAADVRYKLLRRGGDAGRGAAPWHGRPGRASQAAGGRRHSRLGSHCPRRAGSSELRPDFAGRRMRARRWPPRRDDDRLQITEDRGAQRSPRNCSASAR